MQASTSLCGSQTQGEMTPEYWTLLLSWHKKITTDLWRKPRVEVEEKELEKRQEEVDARV